jgi:hypothetical protein
MIAAGVPPGEAGALAAEIYAAGVASASIRSPGAERTRRYRERHKASQSVTERHANETSPNVTERHQPSQCDAPTVSPIDTKIKNSKKQNSDRPSRGTRIEPDWVPGADGHAFAVSEGLSVYEIDRETARFRDYWKGRAGSGGVKLDWKATWQNWIRSTAEKLGKTPRRPDGGPASSMFHAKFGSEELDAWDNYARGKSGKSMPRDAKGGWTVPTQWPPGYTPMKEADKRPFVPNLKAM